MIIVLQTVVKQYGLEKHLDAIPVFYGCFFVKTFLFIKFSFLVNIELVVFSSFECILFCSGSDKISHHEKLLVWVQIEVLVNIIQGLPKNIRLEGKWLEIWGGKFSFLDFKKFSIYSGANILKNQ